MRGVKAEHYQLFKRDFSGQAREDTATGYTAVKPCYCCIDPPPTLLCAVVHGDTEEELAQVDLVRVRVRVRQGLGVG